MFDHTIEMVNKPIFSILSQSGFPPLPPRRRRNRSSWKWRTESAAGTKNFIALRPFSKSSKNGANLHGIRREEERVPMPLRRNDPWRSSTRTIAMQRSSFFEPFSVALSRRNSRTCNAEALTSRSQKRNCRHGIQKFAPSTPSSTPTKKKRK